MSSFNIKENVFIEMTIENHDLPLTPNIFNEVTVTEHVMQVAPTLAFSLNDASSATVQEFHLTDGMLVSIKIAKTPDSQQPRSNFRIFSGDVNRSHASGHYNSFNCLLDVPKYLGKSVSTAVVGTSSEVMHTICTECGMQYQGDVTEDRQTWIGAGVSYSNWAKHTADAGYISNNSCMVLALRDDQTLLYKDLMQIAIAPTKYTLVDTQEIPDSPTTLIMYSHLHHSASGLLNHWCNYGYVLYSEGVDGNILLNQLKVLKPAPYLAISQKMREEITVSRLDISPFNCGNVHANYAQALYQNFRLKSTFSECLSVLLLEVSNIQLLEVIQVLIGTNVLEPNLTVKSGNYVVIAKTKVLRNGVTYGERLELLRNSTYNTGLNTLIG